MAAEFLSTQTQIAQRHFIAFQVIEKKSKVVAIKNFRRVFGPAAMELADFDFWWDSFKKHKCYKSISNEPKLLTELPVIPLSMIIGKTTWIDQLALRETSRIFRQLVDQRNPRFKEVLIDAKRSVTTMTIDGVPKVLNAEDFSVGIDPEKIDETSAMDATSAMDETAAIDGTAALDKLMMRIENKIAIDIHCSSDPVTIRVEKAVAKAMSILNSLGADCIDKMVVKRENSLFQNYSMNDALMAIPVKAIVFSNAPQYVDHFLDCLKADTLEEIELIESDGAPIDLEDFAEKFVSVKSLRFKTSVMDAKDCIDLKNVFATTELRATEEDYLYMKEEYMKRPLFEQAEWKWTLLELDLDDCESKLGKIDRKCVDDPENRIYWFDIENRTLELRINARWLKFTNIHH